MGRGAGLCEGSVGSGDGLGAQRQAGRSPTELEVCVCKCVMVCVLTCVRVHVCVMVCALTCV